jgi:multicopper oxidase
MSSSDLFRSRLGRRAFLRLAGLGAGALAVSACAGSGSPALISPSGAAVLAVEARRGGSGTVRSFGLRAAPATVDLGGPTVATWAYDGVLPGRELRVRKGDTVQVELANALPAATTIHWHGLTLRNDMDGMPGVTQPAIAAGSSFTYRFIADTPGTYWFHPHTGLQLDRGLYAPLIVEDPDEAGTDAEWVVVLDDWLDGVDGATPESTFAHLRSMNHGDMGAMDMGGHSALLGGDAGDVTYPYYLLNGRTAADPTTFRGRAGDKVRLRLINAGGDTAFRVAVAGHRMRITHTDGRPVVPADTEALLIGMGERYDVTLTLDDGVFPLVAVAEGKTGAARALIRTASGNAPGADFRPRELDGVLVRAESLHAADDVLLSDRPADRELTVRLTGGMSGYDWAIDDRPFDHDSPLLVRQGERVRLIFVNTTEMWHPMHLHGHSFAVGRTGPRKDTVAVLPQHSVVTEFDADNPGQWMVHCHNAYHLEAGMMRNLAYTR